MSLNCLAVIATAIVLASVVACGQSAEEVLDPPTSSTPLPEPSPTPTPEPTLTSSQTPLQEPMPSQRHTFTPTQATARLTAIASSRAVANIPATEPPPSHSREGRYTIEQLERWIEVARDAVPGLLMTMVLPEENQFWVGVKCQKDIEKTPRILREHGIPADAYSVLHWETGPEFEPPRFDCISPEFVDPTTGVSAAGFGGLYVEDGIAYIYLLEPSQEQGERLVRYELGNYRFNKLREVRVLQAQYTWVELREWYSLIGDYIHRSDPRHYYMKLEPRDHRITVKIYDDDYDNIKAMAENESSRLGIPREAVIFVEDWD